MGVCIEGNSPWRNLSSNSGEEGIVGNIVPLIVTQQMLDPFIASSTMMVVVGGGGLSGLTGLCLVYCCIPQAKAKASRPSAE